jgi:hypothetical protein
MNSCRFDMDSQYQVKGCLVFVLEYYGGYLKAKTRTCLCSLLTIASSNHVFEQRFGI